MNKDNAKHGKRYTRIYKIWSTMKYRCYNPSSNEYKYYGERGIKICDEWKRNFSSFYDWSMLNGYNDKLTIDRIDVNGDYTPNNCRWTTMKVQENNKRNNKVLTYNGISMTVTEWSEKIGINRNTLYKRLESGWTVEKTLSEPLKR